MEAPGSRCHQKSHPKEAERGRRGSLGLTAVLVAAVTLGLSERGQEPSQTAVNKTGASLPATPCTSAQRGETSPVVELSGTDACN